MFACRTFGSGLPSCCTQGGGKREAFFYEYERIASGDTMLPGTNVTVGELQAGIDNVAVGLDLVEVTIVFESPELGNAIADTLRDFQ